MNTTFNSLCNIQTVPSIAENMEYPEARHNFNHPLYNQFKATKDYEDVWDGERIKELKNDIKGKLLYTKLKLIHFEWKK